MSVVKGNVVIGQSGGPTAVINESLVGIVLEARRHKEITGIYGARNGIKGILEGRFVDLGKETVEDLEKVAKTPAAALGSCRHKPTKEDCERVFEVFRQHEVRYFFYIGGNDSAETADLVNQIARERSYELRIFHVPKTIDNDLRVTDHCPGYGSAARYVAQCFMGNDLDNRALPGVKIDIVMGRHAGWLTAAAALGRSEAGDGPHLIYVPERPVSLEKMASDVKACLDKHGRCLVACSEGIRGADGDVFMKSGEKDSHGNVQLSGTGALGDYIVAGLKKHLPEGTRVRTDTLGYAQRSFVGIRSTADAAEARMVGQAAVRYAMMGDIDGSIAINRIGDGEDYLVDPFLAKLGDVAKVTKELPDAFMNEEGNDVTEAFLRYAAPLVGPLPVVGKIKGHPVKI